MTVVSVSDSTSVVMEDQTVTTRLMKKSAPQNNAQKARSVFEFQGVRMNLIQIIRCKLNPFEYKQPKSIDAFLFFHFSSDVVTPLMQSVSTNH